MNSLVLVRSNSQVYRRIDGRLASSKRGLCALETADAHTDCTGISRSDLLVFFSCPEIFLLYFYRSLSLATFQYILLVNKRLLEKFTQNC